MHLGVEMCLTADCQRHWWKPRRWSQTVSVQRTSIFVTHLLVINRFLGIGVGLNVEVASVGGWSVVLDDDVRRRITSWLQRLSICRRRRRHRRRRCPVSLRDEPRFCRPSPYLLSNPLQLLNTPFNRVGTIFRSALCLRALLVVIVECGMVK